MSNSSVDKLQPKTTPKKTMYTKTILATAAFVASAAGLPAGPPAYGPPKAHHGPYDETPKPYAYEYGVKDEYSGAAFAQQETSDTKVSSKAGLGPL